MSIVISIFLFGCGNPKEPQSTVQDTMDSIDSLNQSGETDLIKKYGAKEDWGNRFTAALQETIQDSLIVLKGTITDIFKDGNRYFLSIKVFKNPSIATVEMTAEQTNQLINMMPEKNNTYRGCFVFIVDAISVLSPITSEGIRNNLSGTLIDFYINKRYD